MLSIVYQNMRPKYALESHFGMECPNAEHIPYISDINRTKLGDDPRMSFKWSFPKIGEIYWVPKEYLP